MRTLDIVELQEYKPVRMPVAFNDLRWSRQDDASTIRREGCAKGSHVLLASGVISPGDVHDEVGCHRPDPTASIIIETKGRNASFKHQVGGTTWPR
jgi:hypothetical protein